MSRDTHQDRAQLLGALARELRQLTSLGASWFRVAAARGGMTATDLQVIAVLDTTGPTTAGQLADLTGLTTGAITGMLNRLEESGLVRRERDPEDGRRVIVQLTQGAEEQRKIGDLVGSVGRPWEELASQYDDEQIAFLLGFLERSSGLARTEILRLREAPENEGEVHSAPLGAVASGRLTVSAAVSRLAVRADRDLAALYEARFEGPVPEVKAKDGDVSIRYPRRLWALGGAKRAADLTLSAAVPWRIALQVQASEVATELGDLDLAELEVKGNASMVRLDLPVPLGTVPIRISGNASEVTVRRPEGVGALVHLKGWASMLVFDDQTFSNAGNNVRLQSRDYQTADQRYVIELVCNVSQVTVTTA